jgi:hypothetical protein
MRQKKAAIELSIGTVVIIVIAMSMLILGLVLVRTIFSGATDSVDTLNDKVKAEITSLFAKEGSKIGVKLGSDKTAKIKQGTQNFGIGIGALTRNGNPVSEDNLKYKLELTNPGSRQCDGLSIKFHQFPNSYQDFEDADYDKAFVVLRFDIEDGAGECTQRVKVTTQDNQGELAFASFSVEIVQGGIFS